MQNQQWYIVARSGDKRAEIVGPFVKKLDADAEIEIVSERMHELYPEEAGECAFFVEPGERLHGVDYRQGTKNRLLGYRSDLTGRIV